jgi:septin family protein
MSHGEINVHPIIHHQMRRRRRRRDVIFIIIVVGGSSNGRCTSFLTILHTKNSPLPLSLSFFLSVTMHDKFHTATVANNVRTTEDQEEEGS